MSDDRRPTINIYSNSMMRESSVQIFVAKNFSLLCVAISTGAAVSLFSRGNFVLGAVCALLIGVCARNYWTSHTTVGGF